MIYCYLQTRLEIIAHGIFLIFSSSESQFLIRFTIVLWTAPRESLGVLIFGVEKIDTDFIFRHLDMYFRVKHLGNESVTGPLHPSKNFFFLFLIVTEIDRRLQRLVNFDFWLWRRWLNWPGLGPSGDPIHEPSLEKGACLATQMGAIM